MLGIGGIILYYYLQQQKTLAAVNSQGLVGAPLTSNLLTFAQNEFNLNASALTPGQGT